MADGLVMTDTMPAIADPQRYAAAIERMRRVFKGDVMLKSAGFAATVHERAADYLEQAPALALVIQFANPRKNTSPADRLYAAQKFARHCEAGSSLRAVMESYGLIFPLRKLKGKGLTAFDGPAIRALSHGKPSVVSQAIPGSIRRQRQWLSAIWEWQRQFDRLAERRQSFDEWFIVQVSEHHAKHSEIGVVADFVRRGDRPLNLRWDWPKALAESEQWHARLKAGDITALYGDKAHQPVDRGKHPDRVLVNGIEFAALRTPAEIHAEGSAMRHCVSSYIRDVTSGLCSIVSVRRNDQRLATLELRNGLVAQLKGRFNSRPANEVQNAARLYSTKIRGEAEARDFFECDLNEGFPA